MTKAELSARVAEQSGLTKKDAARLVDLTLNTIMDTLSSGERVQLVGFGSFEVKQRSARTARDIESGQPVHVPPAKAVQFRPSKNLKELVKANSECGIRNAELSGTVRLLTEFDAEEGDNQ